MYQFSPEFHWPKDKKAFKNADIWPADVLVDTSGKCQEYWIMTPDALFVPFTGYEAGYYGREAKEKSNV